MTLVRGKGRVEGEEDRGKRIRGEKAGEGREERDAGAENE